MCARCGDPREDHDPGELAGQTFGRWRVIWRAPSHRGRPGKRYWCVCSCGVIHALHASALLRGGSRQCRECYHRWGKSRAYLPRPGWLDVVAGLREI